MSDDKLIQSLSILHQKIDKLIEQRNNLQARILILESENKELKDIIEADKRKLAKADQDIEFLTMSHRIADTPEKLISARQHISKLIRTIDNCIRMINED
ncbi:MAG: hypothetical protein J1E78_07065 [Muribaculaceae bacterium]|nr:hypothetical protein [Muribaculaceae bacterium]